MFVRRMNMRAFELSASYGMTGWVLANRMSKIRDPANKALHATAAAPGS